MHSLFRNFNISLSLNWLWSLETLVVKNLHVLISQNDLYVIFKFYSPENSHRKGHFMTILE
jgi:hypothetical protein